MNNNARHNRIAINQFRKELKAMFDDIREIDEKVLTKAVSIGVKDVKANTNVVTSFMRKSWRSTPVKKSADGVSKAINNYMDYAPHVNYGHRIVNNKKETVGFVKGQFMLEKAVGKVDKAIVKEFKKEVERVNRKHDK
ncbi:MAG TPA: HK97 gp10 family phage protein [Bacteroidales bacterium]|nr:HK97 gp10 family phage protein [Bacteroidales bacterium]